MRNEKNNEVIGIIGAVALLIALIVTVGTVIYGAFGGYGSFYEMFCASVRNVLITWAISAAIALLFSAIAGIVVLFGRLCLNARKSHRNHISDTWAFDILAVVRGGLAVETGDGIRPLG